jgi:hypothetical protein
MYRDLSESVARALLYDFLKYSILCSCALTQIKVNHLWHFNWARIILISFNHTNFNYVLLFVDFVGFSRGVDLINLFLW